MPKRNIELAVADYARDYAESLTASSQTALLRVDDLPAEDGLAHAFNVAEYYIDRLVYYHSQPGTPFLVVREEPHDKLSCEDANSNSHYHVFLQLSGTLAAFRAAIKRVWTGNAGYSLKSGDPKLIAQQFNYLCKGNGTGADGAPAIIDRSDDITDDIIAECHDLYWKNNDAIQSQKAKRGQREDPAAHQILVVCRNKLESTKRTSLSEDDIIDITFEWYATRKWSMNTFQMKAVITWVSYNLNPDGNRTHLAKLACKY